MQLFTISNVLVLELRLQTYAIAGATVRTSGVHTEFLIYRLRFVGFDC